MLAGEIYLGGIEHLASGCYKEYGLGCREDKGKPNTQKLQDIVFPLLSTALQRQIGDEQTIAQTKGKGFDLGLKIHRIEDSAYTIKYRALNTTVGYDPSDATARYSAKETDKRWSNAGFNLVDACDGKVFGLISAPKTTDPSGKPIEVWSQDPRKVCKDPTIERNNYMNPNASVTFLK